MKHILTGALGLLLAGTLCIGSGTVPIQAQAPAENADLDANLSISARFDYDDKIRVNYAVPAFIEITNSGPATDAVARVLLDQNTPTAYDLPVHLEQGASINVTIPFYALQRQERVEVKLLRGGKTVAVADPNRAIGRGYTDDKLVGILSGNPDGMLAWHQNLTALAGDTALSGGTGVTTVDMTAKDFPDQIALLDRFALLILNHYDLSLLDDVQQDALVQWVRDGGRLLVDGDVAGARALQSLGDVVALEAAGSLSAADAVEQLGALTGRSYTWDGGLQGMGKVSPAGTVIAGSAGAPLIMRHEAGAGKVFVTAFALDDPFFQQTRAAEIFTEIAGLSAWDVGNPSYAYGYGNDYTISSAMFDAAASISWLDAPSLGWIVLVLLAFIVLAGPVNYFVLKKMDKRDWLWVTTPGLAVVFCVLVMGLGMGRNQTVTSTITVVDSRAGSGSARTTTLVGLGAARQGRYELVPGEAGIPFQTQNYNYTNYYNTTASQADPISEPTLVFGTGGTAAFGNIPQWNMDSTMLRRENVTEGRLDAQVHYAADGTVTYTVKNNTGAALEDVTLLSHLGYCHFTLLENGEEQSGKLAAYGTGTGYSTGGAYLMNNAGYSDLLWAYRDANPTTPPANEDEQREAYLKSGLVNALVGNTAFSGATSSYTLPDSALIWGWSAELGSLPLTVNGRAVKNELNRTMVLSSAAVTYDGQARLAVPVASADGTVSDMQNVRESYTALGDNSAMFGGGEVTFSFDLPGTVGKYTLESLVIFAQYEWGVYEASLYNNATDDWDPYVVGTELDGGVDDYLDENGTLLLKIEDISSGADESVLFEYPTVSVAGKERSNGDG